MSNVRVTQQSKYLTSIVCCVDATRTITTETSSLKCSISRLRKISNYSQMNTLQMTKLLSNIHSTIPMMHFDIISLQIKVSKDALKLCKFNKTRLKIINIFWFVCQHVQCAYSHVYVLCNCHLELWNPINVDLSLIERFS